MTEFPFSCFGGDILYTFLEGLHVLSKVPCHLSCIFPGWYRFFPYQVTRLPPPTAGGNICLIHIPLGCQVEGSWGVATKEALIISITSAADNVTRWPWKMAAETTPTLLLAGWCFFSPKPIWKICDNSSKWVIFFLPRKGKGVKIEKIYLSCHHLQKMGLHSLKLTTNGPENRPVRKRKWSSSKHQFPGANS